MYKFASEKNDAETMRLNLETTTGSNVQDGSVSTDANAAGSFDSLLN